MKIEEKAHARKVPLQTDKTTCSRPSYWKEQPCPIPVAKAASSTTLPYCMPHISNIYYANVVMVVFESGFNSVKELLKSNIHIVSTCERSEPLRAQRAVVRGPQSFRINGYEDKNRTARA